MQLYINSGQNTKATALLDDTVVTARAVYYSDKFDVGQRLSRGCVLAPPLFNMFFTAVLRGAEKRFLANAAIMDNTVQLQRKEK